jgi:hypothetical protein
MAHRNDAQPIGSSSSLERTQQVQRVQQETDLGTEVPAQSNENIGLIAYSTL